MATKLAENKIVQTCLAMSQDIMKLPAEHMWIDYDKEADVLYLSFRKPQRARKTIEAENDILIRKDGDKVVGITILHASDR
jgi:uncharacterized protein YuzE